MDNILAMFGIATPPAGYEYLLYVAKLLLCLMMIRLTYSLLSNMAKDLLMKW